MHLRDLLALLALWTSAIGTVHAQPSDPSDASNTSPSPAILLETCLNNAANGERPREACIGISLEQCTSDALTTVDMLGCLAPETEVWEARLDIAFAALRAVYVEQDADEDPARALAPRLDVYQSQWSMWRDARCGFEYDKFRGGSLGRITSADCRLVEAARRALELEDLIEERGL
jgi:uncharacterized protein YecT (DUF1311 family)